MYLAKIKVYKKEKIKNPEVQTLQRLLDNEKIPLICKNTAVLYEFEIDAQNEDEARDIVQRISQDVLSNPIIEEYQVELCVQE